MDRVAKISLIQLDHSKAIFLEIGDKSHLIVSSQDFERAKKEIKVSEVFSIEDLKARFGSNLKLGDLLISFLDSLDIDLDIDTVKIPADFPAILYEKLSDSCFELLFFDEEGDLNDVC